MHADEAVKNTLMDFIAVNFLQLLPLNALHHTGMTTTAAAGGEGGEGYGL